MKKLILCWIIFMIGCSGGGGGGSKDDPLPLPEITSHEIYLKTIEIGNRQCDYTNWYDMIDRCPDHLFNVTVDILSAEEEYFLIFKISNPSLNIAELIIESKMISYSILADPDEKQSEIIEAWVAFFINEDEAICGIYEVDAWIRTFNNKLSNVYAFDINLEERCQ